MPKPVGAGMFGVDGGDLRMFFKQIQNVFHAEMFFTLESGENRFKKFKILRIIKRPPMGLVHMAVLINHIAYFKKLGMAPDIGG